MSGPALMYATTTLVVQECCVCGAMFAMGEVFEKERRRKRDTFYCPAGHAQHFTSPDEMTKLRDRVARAEARLTHAQDQADAAERSARAYKGQATKLRRRAAAGVCAFCHRHFPDVKAHVDEKHPEEAEARN